MLRIAGGLLLATLSSTSFAASHYLLPVPTKLNADEAPQLSVRWDDSFVTGFQKAGIVTMQWFQLEDIGFRPRAASPTHVLTEWAPLANKTHFTLADLATDPNGGYALIGGSNCGDNTCDFTWVLSAHDTLGRLDTARVKDGMLLITNNSCKQRPQLFNQADGVWLFDGCNTVQSYDSALKAKSKITLPERTTPWKLNWTPWWGMSSDGKVTPLTATLFAGRQNGDQWESCRFGVDGTTGPCEQLSLPVEATGCKWAPGDKEPAVMCQTGQQIQASTLKGEWSTISIPTANTDEKSTLSLLNWSGFTHQQRFFSGQGVRVTTVATDTQPARNDVDWRTLSVRGSDGSQLQSNENLMGKTSGPILPLAHPYELSPLGNMAFGLVATDEQRWSVSIYQSLQTNHPPRWKQSASATLYSGDDVQLPLNYDDDTSPTSELTLTTEGVPAWATVTASTPESTGQLSLSPYHDNAGDYAIKLHLLDPELTAEQQQTLPVSVKVIKRPYLLLVYEPTLFAEWKLTEPIPLSSLLSQMGKLPFREDLEARWQFSWQFRSDNEITLQFENLPLFLHWDGATRTLSGTPTQADTAVKFMATLLTKDKFADIDPETNELLIQKTALPMTVVEIDEPPVVISTPPATAMADSSYSYQLKIEDEESDASDIRVKLVSSPNWLKFDADSWLLSGTPSQNDIGATLIHLAIQDKVHNTVVHSFTITVTPNSGSNGGAVGVFWIALLLITIPARLLRKTPRRRVSNKEKSKKV